LILQSIFHHLNRFQYRQLHEWTVLRVHSMFIHLSYRCLNLPALPLFSESSEIIPARHPNACSTARVDTIRSNCAPFVSVSAIILSIFAAASEAIRALRTAPGPHSEDGWEVLEWM
jgi:hypothetical protein